MPGDINILLKAECLLPDITTGSDNDILISLNYQCNSFDLIIKKSIELNIEISFTSGLKGDKGDQGIQGIQGEQGELGRPIFSKVLSGYSVIVLQSEHEIVFVRGLRVCKPTGQAVEVLETYNGNDIQIDSNILLDDHILTIY